jgi:hypothetical protein
MEIFPDPTHPLLGFAGATLSGLALWVADTAEHLPPQAQGWIQLGGTIGLVSCLAYACKTLWSELQTSRKETAALNSQMREDWKHQNEKLIDVLEKLDPDSE